MARTSATRSRAQTSTNKSDLIPTISVDNNMDAEPVRETDIEVVQIEALGSFISQVVFGGSEGQFDSENWISNDQPLLASFINSTQPEALYVIVNGHKLTVANELRSNVPQFENLIIVVKLEGSIRADRPLMSQLHVLNIPYQDSRREENQEVFNDAYEQIHNLISLAVGPYFDFVAENTSNDGVASTSITNTRKKFNELTLSLSHLQQKIQIPDLLLSVSPEVRLVLEDPGSVENEQVVGNTTFLNELTKTVNSWIRSINSITSLDRIPSDESSLHDEIQFWKSLETALDSLAEQIDQPEVKRAIEILNIAKRFQTTLAFQNNLNLTKKLEETRAYNGLLKDLPIENLLGSKDASQDLQSFASTISVIFAHIKRWKSLNSLALSKLIDLIEMLLAEIVRHLAFILNSLNLLTIPFKKFKTIYAEEILPLLEMLENNVKFMVNVIRELMRKRQDKFMIIKIDQQVLTVLLDRLEGILHLREEHDCLLFILTFFNESEALSDELQHAYNKRIPMTYPFDFSRLALTNWDSNEGAYFEDLSAVREKVAQLVNRKLEECITFADYMRLFQRVNVNGQSFSRLLLPLVDEKLQLRILNVAYEDMQDVFKLSYSMRSSEAVPNPELGFESVLDHLVWNISLKSKVQFYLQHINIVLGDKWNKYSTGSKIQQEAESFLQNLKIDQLVSEWITYANSVALLSHKSGSVLTLKEDDNASEFGDSIGHIVVNFNPNLHQLIYQTLEILALNFDIPVSLLMQIEDIRLALPIAQSLAEHLEIYEIMMTETFANSSHGKKFGFLLESQKQLILTQIEKVLEIEWPAIYSQFTLLKSSEASAESIDGHLKELQVLEHEISSLHSMSNMVQSVYTSLEETCYPHLLDCEYSSHGIATAIDSIREELFKIAKGNFTDIDRFVKVVNSDVQHHLERKCISQLHLLDSCFGDSNSADKKFLSANSVHVLLFENRAFELSPPLGYAKAKWIDTINGAIEIIQNYKPISLGSENCTSIMEPSLNFKKKILELLQLIDDQYSIAGDYLKKWNSLLYLFDIDLSDGNVLSAINGDHTAGGLEGWIDAVTKTSEYNALIDRTGGSFRIGNALQITFSRIQTRVLTGFEIFKRNFMEKFMTVAHEMATGTLNSLTASQRQLEGYVDVQQSGLLLLQVIDEAIQTRLNIGDWSETVQLIKKSQTILHKFRVELPADWIYAEQLENKLTIVETLLSSRDEFVSTNHDLFALRLKSEFEISTSALRSLQNDWNVKKPISGGLAPADALSVLARFQLQCNNFKKSNLLLRRVADFLDVYLEPSHDTLDIEQEIKDFSLVWSTLQAYWDSLEKIKSQTWESVHVRSLKLQLEGILTETKSAPVLVRQYSAFDELQELLKRYLKKFSIVADLKNASLKPRHWDSIFELTNCLVGKELNVRNVLDINFDLHEQIISNIINKANGEKVIEEEIQSINKEWSLIVFETFNFEGKCRLIKNWHELFEQCTSNLNTLASIKNSSYHGPFEVERTEIELKLNSLFNLLDVWIEVQRQWVYLEGVFGRAEEIKVSLPIEAARFNNISFEYLALMKRANLFNLVIEVLSIANIQTLMEKLSDALTKTRKGLTEYLDRQRENFPRLYFVGNDDLLELIGSSNLRDVDRHLKQMFAGVSSVEYDADTSRITSVRSPQGEVLPLKSPISLIKHRDLTQWLSELENELKLSLAANVRSCIELLSAFYAPDMAALKSKELFSIVDEQINQAVVVASQVQFCRLIESSDFGDQNLAKTSTHLQSLVRLLTELISDASSMLERRKVQSLIIEVIHQRDTLANLLTLPEAERRATWSALQRVYFDGLVKEPLSQLIVAQGTSRFIYGYEYQGVIERLASTPLVDQCFLAMSQALAQKMGGSPFGPAGTGKTECVKALGGSLGRMVLVFNCDDTFDYQSMGRILLGICRVGCWGCFDEFNRLDANILSAISSQVENIEIGLQQSQEVDISGRLISIHPETGIFVTMNPGYVGRNELPENLKKLFRAFAMDHPDKNIIADVLLASQCFTYSKHISDALIPFFDLLSSKLSQQSHYDFGLRALKTIVTKCGLARRDQLSGSQSAIDRNTEMTILVQSLTESITPKLIKNDKKIFENLLSEHFSGITHDSTIDNRFITELESFCSEQGLSCTLDFIQKAWQVAHIQESHHGIMLVGKAGSGKSTTYKGALAALSKVEKKGHEVFVIDSKIISKENLFGSLDLVTREWTDGLFTKILRSTIANLRGEQDKRTWIVFDGDIDPQWAENFNSVLDDNKLLTLPNGERLELPSSVRIIFEVDSLEYCTLATISRCGMVWFDRDLVKLDDLWKHNLHQLELSQMASIDSMEDIIQRESLMNLIKEVFTFTSTVFMAIPLSEITLSASSNTHIMDFDGQRASTAYVTHFASHLTALVQHRTRLEEAFNMEIELYVSKAILLSLIWAFTGDCSLNAREEFGKYLSSIGPFQSIDVPPNALEFKISLSDSSWESWSTLVQTVDLEPHHVLDSRTIVPTIDTAIHESLISGVINTHSPLILCGPPGSGKTMTLLRALRDSLDLDVIPMNFSKDTSPESLLNMLEQYCEYKKTNFGVVLTPKVTGKWVVVFCDEVNLPAVDRYGSQRVIQLLRQLVEHGGFWRTRDHSWVTIQNIQFVGACNDPNDPGRHALTPRFMRHVTLVMVDYPGANSMKLIYTSFNRASLKCAPNLRGFADAITNAMLEVFQANKLYFTTNKRGHYIYSPRELTRWCRGILEALMSVQHDDITNLVRLWYHEGLRLFFDRLVEEREKSWCKDNFWKVAQSFFPHVPLEISLKEPVLFSTWLTSEYRSTDELELRQFVKERLRVFSEEELDSNLILFTESLDHSLRIDRVLRQHQGHMILVGPSTSGKATLTKFVAWMNGLSVVQLKVHTGFTIVQFESILRDILLRCAKGEKLCFLIDESSILETSFIERMNSLLANSEVPGLFEGEDLVAVYKVCASESAAQGLILDSDDELYEWFTQQISQNLHVVFTVSGMEQDKMPQVNSSPALFNRCVLNWMGDWSDSALREVGSTVIGGIPLDHSNYEVPVAVNAVSSRPIASFRDAIVEFLLQVHKSSLKLNSQIGPHKFVELAEMFVQLFSKGENELEENQRHTNVGLDKLRETVLEVRQMREILTEKKTALEIKDQEARQMLNKMIFEQNEAERKREFSVEAKVELEKQELEISKRREIVMSDLELAEPAVLEAQRGVQNIKKQHLTEMRSMSNPPATVKMAMESVCILLGYQVSTWRDVQLIVRKDDFIASIVSYDNDSQLTPEMRNYMEEVYLSRSDYNYETIYRASKACGPLLQWVVAQLKYSSILERVGPLREEVVQLQESATKSKAHLIAIDEMIEELEESIEKYKLDYSEVIREAEKIKTDITVTELKANRSIKLIENLTQERERWQNSIKDFAKMREKLVGSSLLSSAFAIYCGALDQSQRKGLNEKWRHHLEELRIPFEESSTATSSLATTTDIMNWRENGLARDDVFTENFAINKWSECPFIVDPTGEVLEVLRESMLPKRLIVTSFLDDSFVRVFEDAMRFGGNILIQNAESYNPIIDVILRKNIVQNGGRKTTEFGGKTIDILGDFKMILYSKVSLMSISSFIASRTTVLNFSITSGNLENQILDITLEHEKPDIYTKRNECIALQSEYQIRLLSLRKLLLSVLNEVSGTILDNDEVIESLEKLETESTDIDSKMSNAEAVMATVEDVRFQHAEIAGHCKTIFEDLVNISEFSKFYNFSLASFVGVFKSVLASTSAPLGGDFILLLYHEIYSHVSPTLRPVDKICIAVAMAISYHKIEVGEQVSKTLKSIFSSILNCNDRGEVKRILESIYVKDLDGDVGQNWSKICSSNDDNEVLKVISPFVEYLLDIGQKALSDIYTAFMQGIVGTTIDSEAEYDINRWVLLPTSTILFSTSEGFDVTTRVQAVSQAHSKKLEVISMGTKEGIERATKAIEKAVLSGDWVLVQNIQLAIQWLPFLEKKLEKFKLSNGFKLFLTCHLNSQIPLGLIASSQVLTYESQPGFSVVLKTTFETVRKEKLGKVAAYNRMCFLLSWYHSVIQERLKYVPASFVKQHDFTDSDAAAASFAIDQIFESMNREVVAPDSIPWYEIRNLVGTIIYGGKLTDTADAQYCEQLAAKIFTEDSYNDEFSLIDNQVANEAGLVLRVPTGNKIEDYTKWIHELPEQIPLSWIGLNEDVNLKVKQEHAKAVTLEVLRLL